MTVDTITFWVWLSPWFILGFWELYVVIQRLRGVKVKTVSIVAKDYGPKLASMVYTWTAMPAHWWWNAGRWGPDFLAWIFWIIPVALLVWDIFCWKEVPQSWSTWKRRARHPLTWMVLGPLAGRYLFPQAGGLPW